MRVSDVREWVDLTEAKLDETNHTVENARLIKAGWSKNGRAYPESVLEQSAGIWDGVQAYADHPDKAERKNRPERSIRDIVGIYENSAYKNGNVYAGLKVLGEAQNWLWPLIKEAVDTGKPVVGLSINAVGKTAKGSYRGKKGIIVEAITHANSVDVVTTPAAGGGFDGSTLMMADGGWTGAVLESVSIDELREARPDIFEALKEEWKTPRDSKALKEAQENESTYKTLAEAAKTELRTAQTTLEKTLAEVQSIKRLWEVDRIIQKTTLPKEWKADLLEQLTQVPHTEWDRILDRELRKAKAVKPRPIVVTGAGSLTETARKPAARKQQTIFGHTNPVGLNESYTQYINRETKG